MAKRTKKKECSKVVMAIILIYGISNGILYNIEVFMGLDPDPALAVQSVITIIGAFISYILYSFGLKNSRNKYGVDENGQPWKIKNDDKD
uniref:Uncharacterized protein n=1 Tax=Siphoviridae sp. ctg6c78 TaxID=2825603 RepID=A0A8S5URP0_9CAUD|nr:MAG TPA: hypothetical protein [Siphoviridae sp. ctg6c78]